MDRRKQTTHTNTALTGVLLAGSVLIAAASFDEASAADFSRAQKIYAPASSISRRVDYTAMGEKPPVPAQSKSAASKPKSTSGGASAKAVKTTVPPTKISSTRDTLPSNFTPSRTLSGHSLAVSPEQVSRLKKAAKDYVASGKLDEAQRILSRVQQMTPQDRALAKEVAALSVKRAREHLSSNNLHDALLSARHALSADPASTDAQKVLSDVHKAGGVNPADVSQRLKLADNLLSEGKYAEAEIEYKASLAVKPTADAHVGIARVHEKLKGHAAAKTHLEKALEIDSNSHAAHRELGNHHLATGDVVGANSELSRALVLNPKDDAAGKQLVRLWQNQVSRVPGANSHLGLARAYQLTGDLQSAQAEYKEVVRLDPNHPYLPAARQSFKMALARQESDKHLKAARTLESSGNLVDAFHRANEAVKLSPGDLGNRVYQGQLLEKLGQHDQARRVYNAILKDDPSHPQATSRLQGLPPAGQQAQAPVQAPALGAIPVSAPVQSNHPAGFPGTKFPFPTAADTAAALAPSLTTPGGVPGDHVSTLSSFIGDLRNQMLTSKAQSEKIEDGAQSIIKALTKGGAPETATTGLTETLHSGSGDDYIEKILKSPVGSALPQKSTAGEAALTSPPAQTSAVPSQAPAFTMPQTAPSFAAPPVAPAAAAPFQTFSQAPPQQAPAAIPQSAFPQQAFAPAQQMAPPVQPFASPDFTGAVPPVSNLPPALQYGAPASGGSMPAASPLRDPIVSQGSPLHFELRNIKPGLSEVQLKVVLRNDSMADFTLPPNYKTVIKHANRSEAEVKTSFKAKTIPAGGSIEGTVHVPMSHVDPYADLVIRNLPPAIAAADGDLHLVTSLSQR